MKRLSQSTANKLLATQKRLTHRSRSGRDITGTRSMETSLPDSPSSSRRSGRSSGSLRSSNSLATRNRSGGSFSLNMYRAAKLGDLESVLVCIQNVPEDVNSVSKKNALTPLHAASASGFTGIVIALLEAGADVHAKDKKGQTPLHHAAANNHVNVCAWLIQGGGDFDSQDFNLRTPLHEAATHGSLESAELLLHCGADATLSSPLSTDRGCDIEVTAADLAEIHRHHVVHRALQKYEHQKLELGSGPEYNLCIAEARGLQHPTTSFDTAFIAVLSGNLRLKTAVKKGKVCGHSSLSSSGSRRDLQSSSKLFVRWNETFRLVSEDPNAKINMLVCTNSMQRQSFSDLKSPTLGQISIDLSMIASSNFCGQWLDIENMEGELLVAVWPRYKSSNPDSELDRTNEDVADCIERITRAACADAHMDRDVVLDTMQSAAQDMLREEDSPLRAMYNRSLTPGSSAEDIDLLQVSTTDMGGTVRLPSMDSSDSDVGTDPHKELKASVRQMVQHVQQRAPAGRDIGRQESAQSILKIVQRMQQQRRISPVNKDFDDNSLEVINISISQRLKMAMSVKDFTSTRVRHKKIELPSNAKKIGDFRVGDHIGHGAAGYVYAGLTGDGTPVALKSILLSPDEDRSVLLAEATVLRRLRHPNIVSYVDLVEGFDMHIMYMVMELVTGGSLRDMIADHGSIKDERILAKIATQVLLGLEYLHRRGIIHRDIKGSNILISEDGTVKLSDFGIAVLPENVLTGTDTLHTMAEAERQVLPRDKKLIGTPYWMAPEIIQEQGAVPQSDVWSFGCTMVELTTGNAPLEKMHAMVALYKAVREDIPVPDDVSESYKDFLRQCFIKNEEDRPRAVDLLNHPFLREHVPDLPGVLQEFGYI